MQSIDILILSNGPGEVLTWVRPVVQNIRAKLGSNPQSIRISLILSPCPHATGKEAEISRSYSEINRVQTAEYFTQFLLTGKTAENWDWYDQGIVIFLGGDQFFTLIIGKRLGYQTVIYTEWEARWYRYIDYFAIMQPEILNKIPIKYHHKFTVVGDLMADIRQFSSSTSPTSPTNNNPIIGLLPGSKPAKLAQGVPLALSIAEEIHKLQPQTKFIIPIAPTLDIQTFANYADPNYNQLINKLGWNSAQLVTTPEPKLITKTGLEISLYDQFPAYELLNQCTLCLTTVGANTAELGSLAIPMIVLIPTQQLDAMRAWDGLPGILANLPALGTIFAKLINNIILSQNRLFAWPNIWAKQQIVPELVGELQPENIAKIVVDYLNHPHKLTQMQESLKKVRGEAGAAQKLAEIIYQICRTKEHKHP